MQRAKAAGLDLVEVAPATRPPVCRIMDYGKWKYQQRKKEQKARSHSKQSELKEVRLRPKIDEHDLSIKTEKARQFLQEGDRVQFTLQFRGREMAHQELGLKTLHDVRDKLSDMSKVETAPRMMGRRMTMILVPDTRTKPKPSPAKDRSTAKAANAQTPPQPSPAQANADSQPAQQVGAAGASSNTDASV